MRLIKRNRPTSDSAAPWKGISFTKPVDSDALHDHLREEYPQYATLRQRKHVAAIEFLKAELLEMQRKDSVPTSKEQPAEYPALPSPAAASSSSEDGEGHSYQGSTPISPSSVSPRRLSASVERNMPDQDSPITPIDPPTNVVPPVGSGQHIVFSALDGRMLQLKSKKKMTIEERAAYKETRKRGACPKCKRQKGKCTHVTSMSKSIEGFDRGKRVTKTRPARRPGIENSEPDKTTGPVKIPNAHDSPSCITGEQQPPFPEQRATDKITVCPQLTTTQGKLPWDEGPRDSGPEISGYVNPDLQIPPYSGRLPGDQESEWRRFPAPSEVPPFDPGYPGFVKDPTRNAYSMYPISPSQNGMNQDYPFPPGYQTFPWTENQDGSGQTNPD